MHKTEKIGRGHKQGGCVLVGVKAQPPGLFEVFVEKDVHMVLRIVYQPKRRNRAGF